MKISTPKYDLRISSSGNHEPHVVTSAVPFILPRVGDLIDPHWFRDNFTDGHLLRVLKVTHMFLQDSSLLTHQQIRIETEIISSNKQ